MIEDSPDAIDALPPAELLFTATIDKIKPLSARTRAYAARRWAMVKYPGDDPRLHRDEAMRVFSP